MVWYQKFEYAIGHWLQKATEHILGCVLCSPGCFSLFRASALMDFNVMKMYTKKSEMPRDFVQYDQVMVVVMLVSERLQVRGGLFTFHIETFSKFSVWLGQRQFQKLRRLK